LPIFVYHCACGQRFERLVPRDAVAPACPVCGSATRKIPAGPSLVRSASTAAAGSAGSARSTGSATGSVPIPWQGIAAGGPEKMKREINFRQRLEKSSVAEQRQPD
jgi:putative FmdB family regulatory protein